MKRKILLLLFLQMLSFPILAETKKTYHGYIRDGGTGEVLIGAVVFVKDQPGIGVATNEYGFYSLTLGEGRHALAASFVGYKSLKLDVFDSSETQNLDLYSSSTLNVVTITSRNDAKNISTITL